MLVEGNFVVVVGGGGGGSRIIDSFLDCIYRKLCSFSVLLSHIFTGHTVLRQTPELFYIGITPIHWSAQTEAHGHNIPVPVLRSGVFYTAINSAFI